ncbi:MAG: GNAT family N-acetyltransferase [Bacteroidota bacterium]
MLSFTTASTTQDLQQILALQQVNLSKNISKEESRAQGFLTVEHDFDILKAMNDACPHVIAKVEDQVVGYTLVMLEQFKDRIPILVPMFEKVNQLEWKNRVVGNLQYFIMGQVCIAKDWRGQGIFSGLYQHMKLALADRFDCIITEVATRNTRSMRAHEKVGFEVLEIYDGETEEWAIVGWDWRA